MPLLAAPFSCDVTPPIGHPLCGGWITPAIRIVDPLHLHGLVLLPEGQAPIVLVAVDWCWIQSESALAWRERLAAAVGTQADRVSIHCVHQHDALMVDAAADRILAKAGLDLRNARAEFVEAVMVRSAAAAREARQAARRIDRIGTGAARVERVACNRRVIGANGQVVRWRGSACKDAAARAQPEGLIDPYLRCVTLWSGGQCVAALHYYATHPMSYYGQGGVSSDFVGLARERLRAETGVAHLYFTGGAGNVSAGKYNDGTPERRPELSARMYAGMKAAFASSRPTDPVGDVKWSVHSAHLPMSEEFTRTYFDKLLADPKETVARRIKGAMGLAWWDWYDAGRTTEFSALHLGRVHLVHLPGESFIEYQLYAQQFGAYLASATPRGAMSAPTEASTPAADDAAFVAVAAYSDCGPAYIPVSEAYPQGGYEVTMAWVSDEAESVMKAAIRALLVQGAA